jgi:hypothetical protein
MPKTIDITKTSLRGGKLILQLQELMADELFKAQTWQDLIYSALKHLSPVSKAVKNTPESVEKGCKAVITHYGLSRGVTISAITHKGTVPIKSVKEDDTTKFLKNILWLERLPSESLRQITAEVKEDLRSITKLIDRYETHPAVKAYLKKGESPRRHTDRMHMDFYTRCINERTTILNYYLKGIKERAIGKSRPNLLGITNKFLESLYDRPYNYARPFSEAFYDIDLLDHVGHRLNEFSYDSDDRLEKLYKENKVSFYRHYFKKVPVQQHFQSFEFYLAHLPIKNSRTEIFKELEKLFKKKLWIGFYALALPQLEGLFSEMCHVINPDSDTSQQSLTTKVDNMRPYHSLSEAYFDYYQYHIPLLRNKFAHTGYDADFKLKSFDLLSDLLHLLKVFSELDDPMVKINQIHIKKDPHYFISISDYAEYFELINALKPSQKKEIQASLATFEKEYLCKETSIDYTINQLYIQAPPVIEEMQTWIKDNLKLEKIPIDIESMHLPEISKILEDPRLLDPAHTIFLRKDHEFEMLHHYHVLLLAYKKRLPSLDSDSKVLLDDLHKRYFKVIDKILMVRAFVSAAYEKYNDLIRAKSTL